jgi:hypothetical protein
MYQKPFYSRRVIEKRKRRLRCLEKSSNYSDISRSSEEENNHIQDTQYSTLTTDNIFPIIEDDSRDRPPPLCNGSRLSTMKSMKSMKLLMDLLISDVNLGKKNILGLLKLIKFILPQPNTLPTTWKSIMKLFGRTNLFTKTFLCSLCHTKCGKTTFSTKIYKNKTCSRSKVTLKTHEIVELVNLDVRTQLKSIINRNINFLSKNADYFPKSDISSGAFYQTTISKSKWNTITLVLHTDDAPLIRTTK